MPSVNKKEEWSGVHADQRAKNRANYPASPAAGPGILKKYEELLLKSVEGKKTFRACVLGATPELRDMVLHHGGELTTVDISEEMVEKYTRLMAQAGSPNEKIIIGSWLDIGLPDNYFDVVLGDGVSNNVGYGEQEKFFSEIKRILAPGGWMIVREGVNNSGRQRRTVQEIDADFLSGKIHWFDLYIDLYFYSEWTDKCRDHKTGVSYMDKFFSFVEEYHKRGLLSEQAFQAVWWFKGALVHTFLAKEKLEEIISRYLKILPVAQTDDFKFTQDTMIFFYGIKCKI